MAYKPFPEFTGNRDSWRVHLGVLSMFSILTVIYSWPLFPQALTHFIAESGARDLGLPVRDVAQHHWNLWWFRYALIDLHVNPYWCDRLFAPHEISLALHTLCPLYGLISIPFQPFLSLNAIYNAILLVGYILAGHGAWLLARSIDAPMQGAMIAGAIFSFFPFRPEMHPHLNIFSVQWMPYCIWAWLGLLNTGDRKWIIIMALSQSVLFHVSLHLLYMTVIMQAGFLIWILRRYSDNQEKHRCWIKHSLIWCVAVFVIAMLALQLWHFFLGLGFAALFIIVLAIGRIPLKPIQVILTRAVMAALLTATLCAPAALMMHSANANLEYDRMPFAAQIAWSADVTDYLLSPWLTNLGKDLFGDHVQWRADLLDQWGFKKSR